MLSDSELNRLLLDLESDRVERKASISDATKIRQAICAFANDLPGHRLPGVVFVGINDDGACSHLPITDELLRTLADMRSDGNTLPFPVMTVQKHELNNCKVVVIEVQPSDNTPVRYNGRTWVRPSHAAKAFGAEVVLVDIGPNQGAINRSAMVATDHVVIPLAPDLFSLQGLRNLGPALRKWRQEWTERLDKSPKGLKPFLPSGKMGPVGYVVMQHAMRMDRPVKAYGRWMERIPGEYRKSVLDESLGTVPDVPGDPYCLSMIKNYRSLMPMAMEARKPMFFLKPADGAIGSHAAAVSACYEDMKGLAQKIANQCGVGLAY